MISEIKQLCSNNRFKDVKKFILCDLQVKTYPEIEKIFIEILRLSGFPDIQLNSKIDFNKLYNERKN